VSLLIVQNHGYTLYTLILPIKCNCINLHLFNNYFNNLQQFQKKYLIYNLLLS